MFGVFFGIVQDDYQTVAPQRLTLTATTNTPVTLPANTRMVRVTNWDTSNRILVKPTAITGASDAGAALVSVAPVANVSSDSSFPCRLTTLHLWSAGNSEVTIEAFS